MTIKLPQRPKSTGLIFDAGQSPVEMWTASDLDAYGKACALAALEEALEICAAEFTIEGGAHACYEGIKALRTELENTK